MASFFNNDPISKVNSVIETGKELITGTLDSVKDELINEYDGKGRMTGTDADPIELLANMKIGGFCNFNDKMYEFMNRLMKINLHEHNITLDKITLGSYKEGDTDNINRYITKAYSYTKDNNYLYDFVIPTKTDEMTGINATRSFTNDNKNPYLETTNLYPDDINGAGTGDFRSYDKWTTKGKNSILAKTKQLFNQKKIHTIISRFGTNADGRSKDLEYKGSVRTRNFGESHGRNLLKRSAEKGGAENYNINGYNNPYCRSWTHHYKYDRLNKTLRPLGGERNLTIDTFHNWAITNADFNDIEKLQSQNKEKIVIEYQSEAGKKAGAPSIKKEVTGKLKYEKPVNSNWKGGNVGWEYSVLDTSKGGDGLLRITPKFSAKDGGLEGKDGSFYNIHTKDCMFSIENLAWKGYDPYSFENALSWEQRGPLGGRIMWFPPYGITFNESTNVNWSKNTFIGRGEDVYTYVNTQRSGNLSFLMVVDHPSIIDYTMWHGGGDTTDSDIDRFFAGCDEGTGKESLVGNVKPTPLTDEGVTIQADNLGDDGLPREGLDGSNGGGNDIDKTNVKVRVMAFFPNNYSGTYDDWAYTFGYLLLGWSSWCDATGSGTDMKRFDLFKEEFQGDDYINISAVDFKEVLLNGKTDLLKNAQVARREGVQTDVYIKNGKNGYETDAYISHDALVKCADESSGFPALAICAYPLPIQKAYEAYVSDKKKGKGVLWYYRVDGDYVDNQEIKEVEVTEGKGKNKKKVKKQVPTGALKDKKNTFGQRIKDPSGKLVQPNDNYKDLKTFKLNLTTENWDAQFKEGSTNIGGNGTSITLGDEKPNTPGATPGATGGEGGDSQSTGFVNKGKRNDEFWAKYPNEASIDFSTFNNIFNFFVNNTQFPTDGSDANQYYKFIGEGERRIRTDFTEKTNVGGANGNLASRQIQILPTVTNEAQKITAPGEGEKYIDKIKGSDTELGKLLTSLSSGSTAATLFSQQNNDKSPYGHMGVYAYVGSGNQPVSNFDDAITSPVSNASYNEALEIILNQTYVYETKKIIQNSNGKLYVDNGIKTENDKQYHEVVVNYHYNDETETKTDTFKFYLDNAKNVTEVEFIDAVHPTTPYILTIRETRRIVVFAGFANPVTFEDQRLRYSNIQVKSSRGISTREIEELFPDNGGENNGNDDGQVSPVLTPTWEEMVAEATGNNNNLICPGVEETYTEAYKQGLEEMAREQEAKEQEAKKKEELICCSLNDFVCAMDGDLLSEIPGLKTEMSLTSGTKPISIKLLNGTVINTEMSTVSTTIQSSSAYMAKHRNYFYQRSENKETVQRLWKLFKEAKLLNVECTGFSNSHGSETGAASNNDNLATMRATRLSELIEAKFGLKAEIKTDSGHQVKTFDHNSLEAKQWRAAIATLTFEVGKKQAVEDSHKPSDESKNPTPASDGHVGGNPVVQGQTTGDQNGALNGDGGSQIGGNPQEQDVKPEVPSDIDIKTVKGLYDILVCDKDEFNKKISSAPEGTTYECFASIGRKYPYGNTMEWTKNIPPREEQIKRLSDRLMLGYSIGWNQKDEIREFIGSQKNVDTKNMAAEEIDKLWDFRPVAKLLHERKYVFRKILISAGKEKVDSNKEYIMCYHKSRNCTCTGNCNDDGGIETTCCGYCQWHVFDAAIEGAKIKTFDFDDEEYVLKSDLLSREKFVEIYKEHPFDAGGTSAEEKIELAWIAYQSRVIYKKCSLCAMYMLVPCGIKKSCDEHKGCDVWQPYAYATDSNGNYITDKKGNKVGLYYGYDILNDKNNPKFKIGSESIEDADVLAGHHNLLEVLIRHNVDIMLAKDNQITQSIETNSKKIRNVSSIRSGTKDSSNLDSACVSLLTTYAEKKRGTNWSNSELHSKIRSQYAKWNNTIFKCFGSNRSYFSEAVYYATPSTYNRTQYVINFSVYAHIDRLSYLAAKQTMDKWDRCKPAYFVTGGERRYNELLCSYRNGHASKWPGQSPVEGFCAGKAWSTVDYIREHGWTDGKYRISAGGFYRKDPITIDCSKNTPTKSGGGATNTSKNSGSGGSSSKKKDSEPSGSSKTDTPTTTTQETDASAVSDQNNAENERLAAEAEARAKEKERNELRQAAERRSAEMKKLEYLASKDKREKEKKEQELKAKKEAQDREHLLQLITPYHLRSQRDGSGDKNVLRYDQEYYFFKSLEKKDKIVYDKLMDKIKYFDPAFHSMTPEGFNARLTFLNQCTRQGNTISISDQKNTEEGSVDKSVKTANNLAFGRPPYCVLRLGDFYNQMIVINSINIDYSVSDGIQWDMNMEGIGMQPLLARVDINFNFIGGSDMAGPVRRLQNAMTFNYYANARYYDNRADRMVYPANTNTLEMGAIDYKPDVVNSTAYITSMRK